LKKGRQRIRDEKIYGVYINFGCTLKEIAEYLGVHYTTVSRAITGVEKRDGEK
jgi:DNA-binding MarR family transcriptional regulator